MEHSRLLKFLVPGRHSTDDMADSPTFKIQYEYQGPSNVEAEVPGSQEIREANEKSFENSTEDIQELDGAVKEYHNGGYSITRTSYSEVRSEVVQGTRVTRTTVTLSGGEASSDVVKTEEKDYVEERKMKTKIPRLKFKQAAEKVRSERRKTKENKGEESQLPKPRTSIPKLTRGSKIPPPTSKPYVVKREISTEVRTLPDDEFERIYEEIIDINETEVIDDTILNNNVDDPDKLESKFEEIIHDYEDNKMQPINVEKIRQSRIPSLKRKGAEVDSSKSIKITTEKSKIRSIPRLKEISMRVKADDEGLDHIVTRKYTKTVSTEKLLPGEANKSEDVNNELSKTSIKYISKGDPSKINKYPKVITTERTLSWKETENKLSKGDDTKSSSFHRSISVASSGSSNKEAFKDSGSKISGIHRSISLSSNDQSKLSTNIDNKVDYVTKVKSQTESIVKESIKVGIPVFESHVSKSDNINEENIQTVRLTEAIGVIKDTKSYVDDKNNTQENDTEYEVETERKFYHINDENPNVSGSITITRISTDLSNSGKSVEIKKIVDSMQSPVKRSENIVEQSPMLKENFNRYLSENVSVINAKQKNYNYDNKKIKDDANAIKSREVENEENKYFPSITKDSHVDEQEDTLKGKVGRLINKIVLMDVNTSTETAKKETSDELPKKKSILSKIAMFERQNIDEPMPRRKARPEKLQKLIIKDVPQETRPHVHTPKIVEEVLKSAQGISEFAIYESNIEASSLHVTPKTDKDLDTASKVTNVVKSSEYNTTENNDLNLAEHTLNKTQNNLDYGMLERRIEVDSKYSGFGSNADFDVKGRSELNKESNKNNREVENAINKEGRKIEVHSLSPVQSNVDFTVYKNNYKIEVDPNHFGTADHKNFNDQVKIRTESIISDYYEHNTTEFKDSKQEEHNFCSTKTNFDYTVNERKVSDDSKHVDVITKRNSDYEQKVDAQLTNSKFERNTLDTNQSQTEEQRYSPTPNKFDFNFDKNIESNVVTDAPVILVSPKINVSKTIQKDFNITNDEFKVGISKTSIVEESKTLKGEPPIQDNYYKKFFGLKGDTYRLKDTSKTIDKQIILPDNLKEHAVVYEKGINVGNANKNQFRYEEISKGAALISNDVSKPKEIKPISSENVMQYENINPDNDITHAGFTKKHIQMYENIKNRDSAFKSDQNQQQYEEITKGITTVSDPFTGTINFESKTKENTVQYENIRPASDIIHAEYTRKHVNMYVNIENLGSAFRNDQKQLQDEEIARGTASVSDIVTSPINFESKLKANTVQYEIIRPINDNIRDLSNSESDAVHEDVFIETNEIPKNNIKCKRSRYLNEENDVRRMKSLAELDLGDAVKGKVNSLIFRMKSVEKFDMEKKEIINIKEMPRKMSVSEKIAMFERKITPVKMDVFANGRSKTVIDTKNYCKNNTIAEEEYVQKIAELTNAKTKYGKVAFMPSVVLGNGAEMPVLAVGTAMLDPRLTPYIIGTAIDLGYRAIDTGYIYGNERDVGEAVKAKIEDGTVGREELFVIGKLWSTFHRPDLVEKACRASLEAMGLDYFDLYLIHNPMSFKEGGDPIPKIATVVQYSDYDFMDAWYGMENLVSKRLVKAIGVSNFNSIQIQRILDKGTVKPAVNQVECHPYLSQRRLDAFCAEHDIKLSCFGTLGSKGTPLEYKAGLNAVIDDPLVQVMASGLNVTAAQLLIRYQMECGHGVVVKSSSAAHLWDNLQALTFHLTPGQVEALHALNRNKRTFTFKGMGDTHKNYPFMVAF